MTTGKTQKQSKQATPRSGRTNASFCFCTRVLWQTYAPHRESLSRTGASILKGLKGGVKGDGSVKAKASDVKEEKRTSGFGR